jgi:hypothetical protein
MNSTFGWFALFTMSNSVVHPFRFLETKFGTEVSVTRIFLNSGYVRLRIRFGATAFAFDGLPSRSSEGAKAGGACRDRTDDLKLAKLALSQLS